MRKLYKVKKPDGGEYPEWHFRYLDEYRELKSKQGFTDKQATLRLQRDILTEVDKKMRALASGERLKVDEKLSTLVASHLDWGKAQGRKGRVWSDKHLANVRRELTWWIKALGDKPLAAFQLNDIESALMERRKLKGNAGLASAADFFRTFLRWCIQRQYRASMPPEEIPRYDRTTQNPFRNLTLQELFRLFGVLSPSRSILYRVALITGARRNELGTRTLGHMDWDSGILTLEFGSAKNKKAFRFWLPEDLVADMADATHGKLLDAPLFESLSQDHAARALQRECRKAGIPIQTNEGRVVFHSLRVTFVTELLGTGADSKTVQTLARHGDPRLTYNVYGKMRQDGLRDALRTLDSKLLLAIEGRQKSDTEESQDSENPIDIGSKVVGATRFESVAGQNSSSDGIAHHKRIRNPFKIEGDFSSPSHGRILAQDEATKKRQKILTELFAICEALSSHGLEVLLGQAELALANESAQANRRPA